MEIHMEIEQINTLKLMLVNLKERIHALRGYL
jgi:hypothetical protein